MLDDSLALLMSQGAGRVSYTSLHCLPLGTLTNGYYLLSDKSFKIYKQLFKFNFETISVESLTGVFQGVCCILKKIKHVKQYSKEYHLLV